MRRPLIFILFLLPTTAYANVVWPALYLETRLFSWWAIGIGLLVEFFFIKWLFTLPVKKASMATVSANAVSAVAGIILIPLAGIAISLGKPLAIVSVNQNKLELTVTKSTEEATPRK